MLLKLAVALACMATFAFAENITSQDELIPKTCDENGDNCEDIMLEQFDELEDFDAYLKKILGE